MGGRARCIRTNYRTHWAPVLSHLMAKEGKPEKSEEVERKGSTQEWSEHVLRQKMGASCYEELIVKIGLDNAKIAETPEVNVSSDEVVESLGSKPVERSDQHLFRSVTMRAAYLAAGRADIGHAVKTLAKQMQTQTHTSSRFQIAKNAAAGDNK